MRSSARATDKPTNIPLHHLRSAQNMIISLLESLLRCLPVNHIPNRAKVLRLPVLVLQVVRMLPRINPQQGPILSDNRILVRIRLDPNPPRLRILHQPRPPTPLNARQRRVHLLLQLIHTAIALIDRLCKRALWWGTTALGLGSQILPE